MKMPKHTKAVISSPVIYSYRENRNCLSNGNYNNILNRIKSEKNSELLEIHKLYYDFVGPTV